MDVYIKYKNYKGIISWRHIEPCGISFGANQWHEEIQWIMSAIDLDKQEPREFAMKHILQWKTPEEYNSQSSENSPID